MTVQSTERTAGPFIGNGVQTAFPFSFRVFVAADLLATRIDTSGNATELVLSSDYTVSINEDQNTSPGGVLTLLSPLPVDYELELTTALEATQGTSLSTAGGFSPRVVEAAFDKLTILLQQQGVFGRQALRAPESSGLPVLPGKLARANRVLAFDANGDPVVIVGVDPSSAAALGLDLADTANNAKGDAKLGVKKTATGAVATTGHEVNERTLDVLDFMTDVQRADYKARALTLDLTTPLNTATAAAKAAGLKLTAGPGSAKITGTVTVDCDADLKAMTVSVAAGSLSGPAVRVGTTADYTFDADIVLPFIVNSSKSGAGWTGFDTKIGVEIANAYHCRILVPKVVGFGVGVTLGGYSKGCVYNVVRLGILSGNKIQLQLLPKTTDGWCNQNLFIGGRLFFDSSEGVNTSGTRMIQLAAQAAATVGPPDSNTFKDITIEDDTPEYYLDVQGSFNRFENCRFETSVARGAAAVRFYSATSGETTSNYIVGGYDTRGFSWTFAGSTSPYNARVDSRENNAVEVAGCGWSIGNRAGDTVGFPHYQGFASGTQPLGKTNAATDWRYRLYADGAAWKAAGDTNARIYTEGASGRLYLGTGNVAATAYFAPGVGAEVQIGAAFYPATDNARTLGLSSNRWSVVYAGTGTINTSDERAKQDIGDIPVEWLEAWGDVKWQRFRFRDAVQQKGDGARWHVGLIAQRVRDAFAARGIDAFAIGLLCFDKWDARPEERDEDGNVISDARPAGEAYGIRYEEALAMECAFLRWKTGLQ